MSGAGLKTGALVLAALALAGCASTSERQAEQVRRQRLADTHTQLGASYLQRGQLEIAKENLEKALIADPDSSQAANMMALLQWRLRNYAEAERYFHKAVDVEQSNPEAQNNYGVFLCERGRPDEAIEWFGKAAANPLYKTPDMAQANAGACLMRKPAPTVAEKYFREALKLNPKLPVALNYMAKISYDSGRPVAARGFIQRYFQAADDTPETLLLAVRIERALRNRNEEGSYALRLKAKFPDSPEAVQLQRERAGVRAR